MKWLKFFIGLILIPTLWALLWGLGDLLSLGWKGQAWHNPWFWSLLTGFSLWTVAYFSLPRPMWVYVFGHELTHALMVYLQGGKVYGFRVASYGGHVKTDTVNWWITLAPYFIPLYCLIWLALWTIVNFYYPLHAYQWILYGGLGITWGFHLTFTISMIRLGQSDISSQGWLFSMVVILLFNLFLLEIFLVGVLDQMTYLLWWKDLYRRFLESYQITAKELVFLANWCWQESVVLWHKLHS